MTANTPDAADDSTRTEDLQVSGPEAFHAALRIESRRCARSLEPLSVLLVEVDGLDETPGSQLQAVAVRAIATAMSLSGQRAGDVFAHLGGRELALVLPGVSEDGALAVADRLVDVVGAISAPEVEGLSATVGCATSSHVAASLQPATLLARAAEALDVATSSPHRATAAYDDSLEEHTRLQTALAEALTRGELHLRYQPTVDLRTGAVTGFEALMRWDRPDHGLLPPDAILAIAEGSTLACDLGRWVLAEAVAQLADWTRGGLDPTGELRIAVNLAARHLANPALLDDVRDALRDTGVSPNQLELDVTEAAQVDHGPTATHLRLLRAMGVRIAIDDFGTGSTGILQLPRLEVDSLKIDQSLIASDDPGIQAVVGVILEAGRAFRLAVVAEGVEDDRTLLALRALGCDAAQGFVFARPMTADAAGPWLTGWRKEIAAGRWQRAEDLQDRQGTWA